MRKHVRFDAFREAMSELAARTGLTSGGAVTAVIDRLEGAGLATRTRDEIENFDDIGFTGPTPPGAGDQNLHGGAQIGDSPWWVGDYTAQPENGGQGVFTLKVTPKVGRLATLRVTDDPEEEVLLITANGMVLRTAVGNISRYGRQTQGVIVMRLAPDDQVVALAPVGVEMEA